MAVVLLVIKLFGMLCISDTWKLDFSGTTCSINTLKKTIPQHNRTHIIENLIVETK